MEINKLELWRAAGIVERGLHKAGVASLYVVKEVA